MYGQLLQSDRSSTARRILAIVLAGLIPYAFRLFFSDASENLGPLHLTFVTSIIASLGGIAVIRGFSKYPGNESVSPILPAVSAAYAVLIIVLLVGRIDYARGMLLGNYVLCCLFLFAQQLIWPSQKILRIAVVRGGSAQPLPLGRVHWVDVEDSEASLDDIDAVTVDLRADLSDAWERRLAELALEGTPVYHIKHLGESLTGRVELEHLSETSYGTLSPPLAYMAVKRAFDTSVAAIALVLLSPVLIVVALLIRLDSQGPAIFRQRRVGFRGRPFVVRKFRTMRVAKSVEDSRESAMTREGDNRITRIGRILRQTRLDELPQLINVLRGEMSLIGPRPEAEILSKWYEQEIPFYRYRHIVLPGVTGWAQINQGHVTEVEDVVSKLHYDFYYVKNLSPWIDAFIMIRTALVMITGRGAK